MAIIITALRAFEIYETHESRLQLREKVQLAMNAGFIEYQPYVPIIRIKDAPDFAYFVLEGQVAVTLANPKVFT